MTASRRFRRAAIGLVAAALVAVPVPSLASTTGRAAGSTATGTDSTSRASTAASTPRPSSVVTLSVMTQNMFYGGDDYDLETGGFCPVSDGCPEALHRIADAILASGADVVGLQEPERNTQALAQLLGW